MAIVFRLRAQSYLRSCGNERHRLHGTGPGGAQSGRRVRAVGYAQFEDDVLGVGPRRSNVVFLGYKGNSAGGGYSPAPDMLRFAQALRNHRLLSSEMSDKVTAGKVSAADDRYAYGFRQWLRHNQKHVRGNSGVGPNSGIDSNFRMFWDGSYTVIVLSNYDPPRGTNLAGSITEFLSSP